MPGVSCLKMVSFLSQVTVAAAATGGRPVFQRPSERRRELNSQNEYDSDIRGGSDYTNFNRRVEEGSRNTRPGGGGGGGGGGHEFSNFSMNRGGRQRHDDNGYGRGFFFVCLPFVCLVSFF